jgi:uncharacterized protein with NRDE domain
LKMCVTFFKFHPVKGIRLIVAFNRDEATTRARTKLDFHFDPH